MANSHKHPGKPPTAPTALAMLCKAPGQGTGAHPCTCLRGLVHSSAFSSAHTHPAGPGALGSGLEPLVRVCPGLRGTDTPPAPCLCPSCSVLVPHRDEPQTTLVSHRATDDTPWLQNCYYNDSGRNLNFKYKALHGVVREQKGHIEAHTPYVHRELNSKTPRSNRPLVFINN